MERYVILKDIFYDGGRLFCPNIKKSISVPVAFSTTIDIHPLQHKVEPVEVYGSCFLHKRHVVGGYVHILMDECWGMFYGIKKYNFNPEFILSLNNDNRPFNGEWSLWLSQFLKHDVKEEVSIKSPILIKNVLTGWATNTIIFKDDDFNYESFPDSIKDIHNIKPNVKPSEIVFDVRSKTRTILNIEQLKKELSFLNVNFVKFDQMSIKRQIQTMNNAKLFISQHGAGLANSIFMNQGCKVMELIQEDYEKYDAYQMICKKFNLNYIKHVEPQKNSIKKITKHEKRDQDLIINIEKLKASILK